ncbi:hypothetical protein BGZ65_003716 [Modicella reniformis]|uniref:Uncharacterized protein n=1 Tax=Modicella reniformis TaxID=1440133 RepID=A0A9P6IZ96_9FUNG|nr:hypothetical protein BGZ65_003716 [Modicella reniformis]
MFKSIDEKVIDKSENKYRTFWPGLQRISPVGHYDQAAELYDALTKLVNEELYAELEAQSIGEPGYRVCTEHLCNWDYMMKDMNMDLKNLWTEDYKEPYLHYFLTSSIKLSECKPEEENPLFKFIDEAMDNSAHCQILTEQHLPGMCACLRFEGLLTARDNHRDEY